MTAAQAADAHTMQEQLATRVPDLVVLDEGLPGIETVSRRWRHSGGDREAGSPSIRIVRPEALTRVGHAPGSVPEGIDFMRPVSLSAVIASIGAILRPTDVPWVSLSASRLSIGRLLLDGDRWEVLYRQIHVPTNASDYWLLALLASHPSKIFSSDAICARLGCPRTADQPTNIERWICELRSRFREIGCVELIEAFPGAGYRIGACS